jgi:hypothetical protein
MSNRMAPIVAASPVTIPALAVGTRPPRDWLEADGAMTWRAKGLTQAVTLKPFYKTKAATRCIGRRVKQNLPNGQG